MRKYSRLSVLAVAGLLAAGCAKYDLDSTKTLAPQGTPYQDALYTEYLLLAVAEDDEWDYEDAEYFNNKAIAAAAGETVTTQPISERNIPPGLVPDFEVALNTLNKALEQTGSTKSPTDAARAVAMFDCWLQEQEEGDQPDHIENCRFEFDKALNKLYAQLDAAPAPAAAPPAPAEPLEFIVFFDFNSAEVSGNAAGTVTQIANAAKNAKEVVLAGHTDTSGANKYNMGLSERRVNAVAAALKAAGVPASKIVSKFFGQDQLRVPTPDNVREFGNRRVTATIK